MDRRGKWMWTLLGFAVLAVSRIAVIYGYDRYWSDVALYHEAAFLAVEKGFRAYHDFWFPYPPMSLPLIYAPMYVASEITAYRRAFQWEMLFFDLGAAVYLAAFLRRRLGVSVERTAAAIGFYAAFGMLSGHLIYDRLDIVIGFVFIASLYHFSASSSSVFGKCPAYLYSLFGALTKLIPLLWTPVFIIVRFFGDGAGRTYVDELGQDRENEAATALEQGRRFSESLESEAIGSTSRFPQDDAGAGEGEGLFRSGTANFAKALLPSAVFAFFSIAIFAYDAATYNEKVGKGLLTIMSEHGARGIQMESTWAMPMMAANLARKLSGGPLKYHIETVYGAQHYKNSELSPAYAAAAKFAGFAALAAFFVAIAALAFRSATFRARLASPEWVLSAMLGSLLLVIATQRVLSPQYLLWIMPGAVTALFASKRLSVSRFVLFSAIFALTYVEFDIGYEGLTRMEPLFLSALLARNLFVIVAALVVMMDVFVGKREGRSFIFR